MRRAIVLCVLLVAVLSGCGSSAPTKTVTVGSTASQTTTQAPTITASAQEEARARAAEAKRERAEKAKEEREHNEEIKAQKRADELKQKQENALGTRYPPEVQHNFLVSCEAHEGSRGSCHCLLRKVEAHDSLAELQALEEGMRAGVPLPATFQQYAEACREESG
jgi:flagellar biosynthesis GTPase FlhF